MRPSLRLAHVASLLALLPAVGCGGTVAATDAGAVRPSSGGNARDFTLDDLQGKRFQLSQHLGKEVILIDFWATWCDPCKAEMPHLVKMYEANKAKGFLVVGVSIDGPESIAQVKGDATQLGLTFPVVLDTESRVVATYNPKRTAPFSVVIDRKGNVVAMHDGYTVGDEAKLAREIEAELAK